MLLLGGDISKFYWDRTVTPRTFPLGQLLSSFTLRAFTPRYLLPGRLPPRALTDRTVVSQLPRIFILHYTHVEKTLVPAMCYHELPQSHCGYNREHTLFS